ncbi:hypothetical protein [Streptantibioticus cattleyicolor]|uniref:Uncharacterized protein n=1 Tax=Streptantibioticus cattleyicolor (strain ATCC 35852 / DSM 46488 / JCM 4925 / NBRC 14057 / NRRL 8057) TaxID=1003195 RepID=F8JL51_STREN|nr:hypothetical protein [Streptantibioticus cattleyicolor]AEW98369.1 hypothetical protein SCATT_p01760 [Streptantibioticus cattleyicolor NRRL 8057 = DSM 46488]CCB72572.1 protein of unknown function [Streptantibioticus cattleyicolor NRRL 8057 = DSM 46488]
MTPQPRTPAPEVCALAIANGGTTTLRLTAPIGDRTLADAHTGRPIALLDDRALEQVGHLPRGYRPDPHEPVRLTVSTHPHSDTRAALPEVDHLFIIGTGEDRLLTTSQTRDQVNPREFGMSPVGTVTVHGRPATVWQDTSANGGPASMRLLLWREGGWTLKVENSGPVKGGDALPAAELREVAEGMGVRG